MAAPVVSAEIMVHIVESTWFVFCVSPTVLCNVYLCTRRPCPFHAGTFKRRHRTRRFGFVGYASSEFCSVSSQPRIPLSEVNGKSSLDEQCEQAKDDKHPCRSCPSLRFSDEKVELD